YPSVSQSIPSVSHITIPNAFQPVPSVSQCIPVYPSVSHPFPVYPSVSQCIPVYPSISQSALT
ncbi:unnamed protein product, partial [Coccothraustes coccothraustes]